MGQFPILGGVRIEGAPDSGPGDPFTRDGEGHEADGRNEAGRREIVEWRLPLTRGSPMDPTLISPGLLFASFLGFLVLLGTTTALVLEVARRHRWIGSWRHPLAEPSERG
ncbi:MAG TPA: hypothetical protein VMW47_09355 [Verrucomicrobiae bacterium]|nr:hypothetical protein [Verrucomicrobiae bacterium]